MDIPSFPLFKSLDVSDKEWIEKITTAYPPFSDFNFTSLHCWNGNDQTSVSLLNNNLVIRMKDYTSNNIIYSIIGHNQINQTVDTFFNSDLFRNTPPKLQLIPETNLQTEKEVFANYRIEEDPNQFDYIYDLDELSKMEGGEFHNKRNLANRFEKENEFTVEIYESLDKNIHEQIIDLVHLWAERKLRSLSDFEDELKAIGNTIEITHLTRLVIITLFVNKKMIGFTISELLSNDYCIIHFEKTDPNFKGISEYLMRKTAEILKSRGYHYLNYQQDLGIEGLRKSKMSYGPKFFLKKYTISPKSSPSAPSQTINQ